MKKLSAYLFLLLFTSHTPSQADDIGDFEIEGMSIGDSLLDYVTEEEINLNLSKPDWRYKLTEQKFIVTIIRNESFETYEYLSIHLKKNDKKYIIHSIDGMKDYENIDECFKDQKKIAEELSDVLDYKKKFEQTFKNSGDETGKSMVSGIYFVLQYGDLAEVTCYDMAPHMNAPDGINVALSTKELWDYMLEFKK